MVKNPPANAGDVSSIPGSGKIPWRRRWQPTPVFLPGKFHGQRSLVGHSPWGHKELDMTEVTWHSRILLNTYSDAFYCILSSPEVVVETIYSYSLPFPIIPS